MDIFEYLPQLIVAYDGNDEFANLIHVKKADREKDYLCPCCGGIVKPRALDSSKEQSHYYHQTGKCTKESQLHFFCKNWLFEKGSKFYVSDELFEVASVDIEKTYHTSFGDYKPDVTVHTTNDKIIYFEIFFTNRKTGDDYFCKWDELRNDVVEVNIKEYMFKTDVTTIPYFTYLYHDGVCYSKPYIKRDMYANTIARIKRDLTRQKVLNYKARIEQLDWFWQSIRDNSRESILEIVSKMEYEDMVTCYEIIKRKQCVSYLKDDILNIINQKVLSDIREVLNLPYDENIYFDLKHIQGRTYEAGIRLNIKTSHITYNDIYKHCCDRNFSKLSGYPKIVFSRNIFSIKEIAIPGNRIEELKNIFNETIQYKNKLLEYEKYITKFEGNDYKIRVNNNSYTVLSKTYNNNFEVLIDDFYQEHLDINILSKEIEYIKKERIIKKFMDDVLNSEKYVMAISKLMCRKNLGCKIDIKYYDRYSHVSPLEIHFILYFKNKILYDEILNPNFNDLDAKINVCENIIDGLFDKYSKIIETVEKINNCKNKFWKAYWSFNICGNPEIEIDQNHFNVKNPYLSTSEKICFDDDVIEAHDIYKRIENAMHLIFENMEQCGYRIMEV